MHLYKSTFLAVIAPICCCGAWAEQISLQKANVVISAGDSNAFTKMIEEDNSLIVRETFGGQTLAHSVARVGSIEMLKALDQRGAKLNQPDWRGVTPLHIAIRCRHQKSVEFLLNKKIPLDIFSAAALNDIESLNLFLKQSPKEPQKSLDNLSALHWAAMAPDGKAIERLIASGCDVSAVGDFNMTPLHMCARYDNTQGIKSLIAHGAKVDVADDQGNTPLMWCVLSGSRSSLQALLDGGATRSKANRGRTTPLVQAAILGRAELIDLLTPGSNLDEQRSAFISAAAEGHEDVLKSLIKQTGLNPKFHVAGRSPLHCAVEYSRAGCVDLLLSLGADVEDTDDEGQTPLHYAALENSSAIASALLRAGANPLTQDKHHQTPEDVAVSLNSVEVEAILKAASHAQGRGGQKMRKGQQ